MNKLIYEHIEDMLQYKESLGYSRKSYEGFLKDFGRYLEDKYPKLDYLTEEITLGWCIQRDTEQSSGYSRRALALREFTKYLFAISKSSYILPSDYTARAKRYTPYIFSDSELIALFQASDHIKIISQSPNRELIIPVMLKLIYFCGLRPNEGREILKEDIFLDEGTILIRKNKSHRERKIPISDDITDMCRDYWNKISKIYPNSIYFFPSSNGKPYTAKWLRNQLIKLWNEIKGNNTARIRVYDMRHRFATTVMMKWLNQKENLYAYLPYLSTYMGHTKLADTAYYIHLLPEKLIQTKSIDWKHFSDLIPEVDNER